MTINLNQEQLTVVIQSLNAACNNIQNARAILPVVDAIEKQIATHSFPLNPAPENES